MWFFDFWYLIFIAPGLLLSAWATWRVQAAFHTYSRQRSLRGVTGAEAALRILHSAGITDVAVVPTDGLLSDHYNPVTKQLALSEGVYHSQSVAAVGIAAHEAGHAIQHATGYAMLGLRSLLVPTANIGSVFGYIVMAAGVILQSPYTVLAGVVLFSFVLLFQLVTLPVEFDATARAKRLVVETGLIYPEERDGMDRVLNAAAWTYVAAVVSSLLVVLYYLWRAGFLGGGRHSDE